MIPSNFRSDYLVWTKGYARFVLALAMAVFSSCSSVTVHTDHDPGTNFARYRTYAFGPLSQNVLALNPSIRAQIESSLTQGLAARGLRRSAGPDFMWHITSLPGNRYPYKPFTTGAVGPMAVIVGILILSGADLRLPPVTCIALPLELW